MRGAAISVLALVIGSAAMFGAQQSGENHERDFLTRIRRLTVDGRRAGEGYWSPDGKKLVFQSEREPGNPFYQIYLMDLMTGDTSRVSTGVGKTTCSFLTSSLRARFCRRVSEAAAWRERSALART